MWMAGYAKTMNHREKTPKNNHLLKTKTEIWAKWGPDCYIYLARGTLFFPVGYATGPIDKPESTRCSCETSYKNYNFKPTNTFYLFK